MSLAIARSSRHLAEGCAAQCVMRTTTRHATAHSCRATHFPRPTPPVPQQKCASYLIKGETVFEALCAHIPTHVQPAEAPTHSGTAVSLQHPLPVNAQTLCTPVRPLTLARFLHNHPDEAFTSMLINGLTHGFRIGYQGPRTPQSTPNLCSAFQHEHVIDEALKKELAENRNAGPYCSSPFSNLRISGLGVIPKSDGSWRLIYHLSAPIGTSINDFIDPVSYSLQYNTLDDAIKICHTLGKNARIAKVDIKTAFRLIPVHKDDWHLLGIRWKDCYYFDKCLPFGLRSAPFLFNMLADAIQCTLRHHFHIHHSFHYLDDFSWQVPITPSRVTTPSPPSCF